VGYDDDVSSGVDVVYARCDKAGETTQYVDIRSDFGDCWRCEGDAGCGTNCPPGELCVQQPGVAGSDCRRYGCTDSRYQPVENGYDAQGRIIVVCRLKPTETCTTPSCVPATVTLSGPTQIRPGATCEWSATASSSTGCSAGDYIYHWYAANAWVGGGQYYTGGKPSGVLNGYPWKLRVEVVTSDGTFAGKHEITVSESSNAPVCFY
jgi:hypothetical protein